MFLKEFFEKFSFEKSQRITEKHEKYPSICDCNKNERALKCAFCQILVVIPFENYAGSDESVGRAVLPESSLQIHNTRTQAHTHARTHARTHKHTHCSKVEEYSDQNIDSFQG